MNLLNIIKLTPIAITLTLLINGCGTSTTTEDRNSHGLLNTPPKAEDLNVSLDEDTHKNITLIATDEENDTLRYTISKQPSNGKLQGTPPNITYQPNKDFFGKDSFVYIATDDKGAESKGAKVDVTILEHDITPPVITLNGDANMTLLVGKPYIEQGAKVSDNRDKNISLSIEGSVNTNLEGNYTIVYKAQDKAGNKTQKTRIVHVISLQKDMGKASEVPSGEIRSVKYGNIHLKLIYTDNEDPSDLTLLKLCNAKKCWTVLDKSATVTKTIHPTQSYYVSDISNIVFKDMNETIDRIQYIYKGKRKELILKEKLYFFRTIIDVLALKLEKEKVSEYLVSTAPPLEYSVFINEEDYRYVSKDGIIVEVEAESMDEPRIIEGGFSNKREDKFITTWSVMIDAVNVPPANLKKYYIDLKNGNVQKSYFGNKVNTKKPIEIYIPLHIKNTNGDMIKKDYELYNNNLHHEYNIIEQNGNKYIFVETINSRNYFDLKRTNKGGI